MVIRDKIGGYKEKQHCRVNMIKEQRISIYEHRIFALQYIVCRCAAVLSAQFAPCNTFKDVPFVRYAFDSVKNSTIQCINAHFLTPYPLPPLPSLYVIHHGLMPCSLAILNISSVKEITQQ